MDAVFAGEPDQPEDAMYQRAAKERDEGGGEWLQATDWFMDFPPRAVVEKVNRPQRLITTIISTVLPSDERIELRSGDARAP